jgi:hypothetical protein
VDTQDLLVLPSFHVWTLGQCDDGKVQEGGIDDVAMTRTAAMLFTSHILGQTHCLEPRLAHAYGVLEYK